MLRRPGAPARPPRPRACRPRRRPARGSTRRTVRKPAGPRPADRRRRPPPERATVPTGRRRPRPWSGRASAPPRSAHDGRRGSSASSSGRAIPRPVPRASTAGSSRPVLRGAGGRTRTARPSPARYGHRPPHPPATGRCRRRLPRGCGTAGGSGGAPSDAASRSARRPAGSARPSDRGGRYGRTRGSGCRAGPPRRYCRIIPRAGSPPA